MDLFILLGIFIFILVLLFLKKPLWLAIGCSILLAVLLYRIPPADAYKLVMENTFSFGTFSVLASFYTITFLQRMLEKRDLLIVAEQSLNYIFRNRRITCMLAPIAIGLLPSAGAVYICGSIVDSTCEDYLSKEDKTFVTSYYRHIPESFLPTYSSILLALQLTGIPAGTFIVFMLPIVAVLIFLGYAFYLRKIPKEIKESHEISRGEALKNLFRSLGSIIISIALIIIFNTPVYAVVPLVIVGSFFAYKFSLTEILPFFVSAFELKIVVNTILVMIFKGVLTYTGVITLLPGLFETFPIPTYLAFALIFFFGTIVGGSTAIIVLCMPLAYAALPDGGIALMTLLMACSYCSMQVSPTHICLVLVTEFFNTSLGALIKRTLPVITAFFFVILVYYNVLVRVIS